jgi:N-acetylglucosaminylphosphatidylinositol deacetylase
VTPSTIPVVNVQMATRPGLYVIFASLPLFFGLLLQLLHSGDISFFEPNVGPSTPSHILLLTAHPDDETFFFGPTLTFLIPPSVSTPGSPNSVAHIPPQVYSLCFSVGNADGLGEVRRHELDDSLDVIGVAKDKRWVLDKRYVSWPCLVRRSMVASHKAEVNFKTISLRCGMPVL